METDKRFSADDIILTDICSKSNKKIYYIRLQDEVDKIKIVASTIAYWNYLQYLQSLIKDIFLPRGYPNSVSSDYLEYQIWDTCQAFCSSICSTLTVQSIMQGIGVGSNVATPVSAAITWIMKDGTGMLGSITFAWLKGSKLDSDCKKWRLFADILNDIAMFIELYIPKVMDYSMYMLCLATAFKALVGTAGSSTRAALITHQAIKGNIADVSAKDGSQEVFTNLIAFLFGIILLKNITETGQVWTVMCTAALFHLIFNYKAVRCLKMNVFNSERLRLSLRIYLPTSNMPSIEHVNKREPVLLGTGISDRQLCGYTISFGDSINRAIKNEKITSQQLTRLMSMFLDKKYFILAQIKKKKLFVGFRQQFSEIDVVKAYFHAFLIGIALTFLQSDRTLLIISRSRKNSPLYRLKNILDNYLDIDGVHTKDESLMLKAFMSCEDFIEKEFAAFCSTCNEEGWNLERHLININDWRAEWKYVPPVTNAGSASKRTRKSVSVKNPPKQKKARASAAVPIGLVMS